MAFKSNSPVHRIKIWPLSAAIWEQKTNSGETFYNFTLQRSYKDDQGEYQASQSFNRDDALALAKICDACHTWIISTEEKAREQSNQGARR
jgi:hypothetical protein